MHPLATDDAGIVERGAAEAEVSLLSEISEASTRLDNSLSLHAGPSKHFDVGVTVVYELNVSENPLNGGMAAPVLDLKARLVEGNDIALALRLDYEAPPLDPETEHGGALTLISSWERERWSAHANLGTALHTTGMGVVGGGMVTTALGDQSWLALEFFGEVALDAEWHASALAAAGTEAAGGVLSLGIGPLLHSTEGPGGILTTGYTVAF